MTGEPGESARSSGSAATPLPISAASWSPGAVIAIAFGFFGPPCGPGFPALAETAGSQSVRARELIVRPLGGLASFGLTTVLVHAPTKAAGDPAFERVAHVQRALPREAAVTTVVRPRRESSGVDARG